MSYTIVDPTNDETLANDFSADDDDEEENN